MIYSISCTALSVALEKLKSITAENEAAGLRTVIFCEDRLSLAAERTVCAAVGGSFLTSVYTFARFLYSECGKNDKVLSSQGSAMAIRRIIEENSGKLSLFKKLCTAGAAQSVYDTIALLYSSRVSAEDVAAAAVEGGVLSGKLKDLALIYSEYVKYLEANGLEDRNGYLKRLGGVIEASPKIAGACVVFLGFQSFTSTTAECARAAFNSACKVYGLFIGGKEDIYVNEATAAFVGAAKDFGGAVESAEGGLPTAEAEILRERIFNPESFYRASVETDKVAIFEADDCEREMEFIAAVIKREAQDFNERYAKISVMLPDLEKGEKLLARTFAEYKIPYYVDRQRKLSEHALCSFVCDLLSCVISGFRPEDCDAVISSPFFPADRADKDEFRNYALRFANYRGGIKRAPDLKILEGTGYNFQAVAKVRKLFLDGIETLSVKDTGVSAGLRSVLEKYGVENKLKELAARFKDERPAEAEFSLRAYDAVLSVLAEAESLAGGLPLKEFVKILKSGFAAMSVSLIPPKADAVFVGDIAVTANTGSNVVFAARLCGDVPDGGSDTALLTDREIAILESLNLNVSPKIRQVYERRKEVVALNICAFRRKLYLTYPARMDGEETGASEIVSYASAAFHTVRGGKLAPVDIRRVENSGKLFQYYCSEKLPAIKQVAKARVSPALVASAYRVLRERGYKRDVDFALEKPVRPDISCGERLYLNYGAVTPTSLETYFTCPYLGFMRQGLKLREREEGAVRPVDTGNFIHSVLQELSGAKQCASAEEFKARARGIAEAKLKAAPYSSLLDSAGGRYTAEGLVKEAVKISGGMYEQLRNSLFDVAETEYGCEIRLTPKVKLFGRIDRVDESGDMVRIIDYKTGGIDASPSEYYTGAKLQLPLYLLAASSGKRAVGAYYFPASVEYRDKADGVFRLQGFMDGSEDVVTASDINVQPKAKSNYFDAYRAGRKVDAAMTREDFGDFLGYSLLVAGRGAEEMVGGNIRPSPSGRACEYCKMGASCGFGVGEDGEPRSVGSVKCTEIAEIARKAKENADD